MSDPVPFLTQPDYRDAVTVSTEMCYHGAVTHPFPVVAQLHWRQPGIAEYRPIPSGVQSTWANREMLCLLLKCDGLLFSWKEQAKDKLLYRKVWYFPQKGAVSSTWVTTIGHPVRMKHYSSESLSFYYSYFNEDIPF